MKQSPEIKKNWTWTESFDILFYVIKTTKILFLEGKLSTTLFLHPFSTFF